MDSEPVQVSLPLTVHSLLGRKLTLRRPGDDDDDGLEILTEGSKGDGDFSRHYDAHAVAMMHAALGQILAARKAGA